MAGLLIAVEGIDGAGTTTQCQRIVTWLESRGQSAHLTREPSTGPVGQLLRALLRGEHAPVDPATVALLFAADRLDHLAREIAPRLAAGTIVVSDRYLLSSLAYQPGPSVARAFVAAINGRAPAPDVTLMVEVPPAVAAARRRARGGPEELFDAAATQERVAAAYHQEAEAARAAGERVLFVDGSPDPDTVFAACAAALESCLPPPAGARST